MVNQEKPHSRKDPHETEKALFAETDGAASPKWKDLVNSFMKHALIPEVVKQLSSIRWSDGSHAKHYLQNDSSGYASDFIQDFCVDIITLLYKGIPVSYSRSKGNTLAGYLAYYSRNKAIDRCRKIKRESDILKLFEENDEIEESIACAVADTDKDRVDSASFKFRLLSDCRITSVPACYGGMQLFPRLDWLHKPAPELSVHLKDNILQPKGKEGWDRLADMHAEADNETNEQCAKYLDKEDRSKTPDTKSKYECKLADLELRRLLMPLDSRRISRLTGRDRGYVDTNMMRYRNAMAEDKIIDMTSIKMNPDAYSNAMRILRTKEQNHDR